MSRWTVQATLVLSGLLLLTRARQHVPVAGHPDYRIYTFKDVVASKEVTVYNNSQVTDYLQLTLDIPRKQLLIGARNYLLRLDIQTLKELEVAEWKASNTTVALCKAKGRTSEDCQNLIKVLLVHKDRVFACGTNAFAPQCTWRQVSNIKKAKQTINGIGKSPYDPHDNNTALMTQNGDLYSATYLDFAGRDPALFRIMGPSRQLRTVQRNSRWLNAPDFVSMYEIDNYVYLFFRETAVEYINCGKNIYARVARICKSDSGGSLLLEHNWTTFIKARLNCSLPGNYPFYFNEIQSTYFDREHGIIYAVFTTPPNSLPGSAVCAYNLTAFHKAFSGPYKYQEGADMAWKRVPNPAPIQCAKSSTKRSLYAHQTLADVVMQAQIYQMMDLAIQPTTHAPIVMADGETWSHLVVDRIHAKHRQEFTVVFVASWKGVIKKIIQLPGSKKTCVVEEIEVTPEVKPGQIKVMKLLKNMDGKSLLYVGTSQHILRIPVQRCSRFTRKLLCMNAMDPYCGWDARNKRCTTRPTTNKSSMKLAWHQNISSCPILSYPVDGGWSAWTGWAACRHIGLLRTGDNCMCRSRSCDMPKPLAGGRVCRGPAVEVSNCTSNGGWTEWSEWSGCSQTCGIAVRSRHRRCGNPSPRYGGRVCVGAAIDEQYCHENPECPPPPGGWSSWSSWNECSADCGGGIRMRQRKCNNPLPIPGGLECVGNDQDWQMCNTRQCEELRRSSEWTQWGRSNVTKDGYTEQRYRFVCKANVPDHRMLRVSHPKVETRFCPEKSEECGSSTGAIAEPDIDGGWTFWSAWSRCSVHCGGGIQWRERTCTSPAPSGRGRNCKGHGREAKECNIHSCQGMWSCWSEFSACSVSCGQGQQWRARDCVANSDDARFTIPCAGRSTEERVCNMPSCPAPSDGWGQWSLWSLCHESNTQRRTRVCQVPSPSGFQCRGADTQTRMCRYNEIEIQVGAVTGRSKESNKFQVIHLVIVGIVAFLVGGVVAIAVFLYCQRHRQQPPAEEPNKFENLLREKCKPNLYMTPSQINLAMTLNNKYYSTGSLTKDNQKMTVKEATLKRNSLMRTNLSLNDL